MSTDLFNTSREVPLFIDTDALETSVGIKSRMEGLDNHSNPIITGRDNAVPIPAASGDNIGFSIVAESTKSGLPRFQLLHKEHECRIHVYPVTEGLLEVHIPSGAEWHVIMGNCA